MSDTDTPQGVLGVASMPTYGIAKPSSTPMAHSSSSTAVSDPGNLGVIMRTAEAAGCKGIFLTRGSVEVYNPKVVRATMGAIFRLPVFPLQDGPALLHSLRQRNIQIVAAHTSGISFHKLQIQNPVALLLGNEAFGINPALLALSDHTVTIPMAAPVESLNIAVATGILLYQIHTSDGTGTVPYDDIVVCCRDNPLWLSCDPLWLSCDPLWSPVAVSPCPSDSIKKTHPPSSRVGFCDLHRSLSQIPTA